jgi:hypothetical protein
VTRCRRRFGARVLGILLVVALAACADEAGGDPGIARSTTPAPQAADVAPAPEPGPEVAPGRSVGAASPQERLRRVTLVAGGDVLVHSAVWESARTHAGGEGFDFAPMFEPIAAFVAGADLAICHLEVPLSADNAHLASYPRFSAPFELADGIRAAGFDGCSVASNHVLDQGVAGIDATLDHLDRVGLGHAGAARTPEEAHSITTYEVRGTRIAHLSYTYGFNGHDQARERHQDLQGRPLSPRRGAAGDVNASVDIQKGEFVFLVGSVGLGQVDLHPAAQQARRCPSRAGSSSPARTSGSCPTGRSRTCAATSGASSRTSSCCPTRRCTRTWRSRSR